MKNEIFFKKLEEIGYLRDREVYDNNYLHNILALRISENMNGSEQLKFIEKLKDLCKEYKEYQMDFSKDKVIKDKRLKDFPEIFNRFRYDALIANSLTRINNSNETNKNALEQIKSIPAIIDLEIERMRKIFKEELIAEQINYKIKLKEDANIIINKGVLDNNIMENANNHLYGYQLSKEKMNRMINSSGYDIFNRNFFDSFARFAKAYSMYKNTKEYLIYNMEKVESNKVETKKVKNLRTKNMH